MRKSVRAAAAPATSQKVVLSDLGAGDVGAIVHIKGTAVSKLHLMEMGLTPGTQIKVVRVAAFGGPLDITVRGYRLSIRRDEARSIELSVKESRA